MFVKVCPVLQKKSMRSLLLPLFALAIGVPGYSQTSYRFSFQGHNVAGYRSVASGASYSDATQYGFEPSLSGGSTDRNFFSVKLPEGNYTARLTFEGLGHPSVVTVKAESGRLLLDRLSIPASGTVTRSLTTNLRTPALPKLPLNAVGREQVTLDNFDKGNSRDWDDRLTFEFDGPIAALQTLEIESISVPTLFLAGDSTVTDRDGGYDVSWGQVLPLFFKEGIAIANHAQSGETLKSFANSLRFDKILSVMRPGDYLFLQFGHNDSKESWPQTYVEPSTTYKAWLRVYIAETRRRGAIPVLVTSMERGDRTTGMPTHAMGGYPEAMRQVAAEQNVALIDLNAMSDILYKSAGANAPKLLADGTHSTAFGGYEFARCIVQGIRNNHLDLVRFLGEGSTFDPSHPDSPEKLALDAIFPETKPQEQSSPSKAPGLGPI